MVLVEDRLLCSRYEIVDLNIKTTLTNAHSHIMYGIGLDGLHS